MFEKILVANDGSDPAFRALSAALALARQNHSELHMVCVEEVPYLPELLEEVREAAGTEARRLHHVVERSKAMAAAEAIPLATHLIPGHPVRDIVKLAADLGASLLVIGARGHSAFYERMIGSRADRIVQLAPCPVLILK
ncbi:universal stress protein [Methylacidimicrobium sp. B4]|uniref:universal stress protein n=1 Tax=Methylacidimicrobium sp. B4 TaxID=2796139 RepID=UPI001F5C2E1B|nr:universal stress protein [Methylacidimicrobium sp. B4]